MRLRLVAHGSICLGHLHSCRDADGVAEQNAGVVKNSLKFGSGFGRSVGLQVGLAAHVNGIQVAEETKPASRYGQVIWSGRSQQVKGVSRVAMLQRRQSAKHRQISELHNAVLREPFETLGEGLGG